MDNAFVVELLKNFGFPIVVAGWFMFRMERIIGKNTEAINNLALLIEKKR